MTNPFYADHGVVFVRGAAGPGLALQESDGRDLLASYGDELRSAVAAGDMAAARAVSATALHLIAARCAASRQRAAVTA